MVIIKIQKGLSDLYHNGLSLRVNPLKSSIEIELINELCYLKTNRLRSVFRMTSRSRLEDRLAFSKVFSGYFTANYGLVWIGVTGELLTYRQISC